MRIPFSGRRLLRLLVGVGIGGVGLLLFGSAAALSGAAAAVERPVDFGVAVSHPLPVELDLPLEAVRDFRFDEERLFLETPAFRLLILFSQMAVPVDWTLSPRAFRATLTLPPSTEVRFGQAEVDLPLPRVGERVCLPSGFRARSFGTQGLSLVGDLWVEADWARIRVTLYAGD